MPELTTFPPIPSVRESVSAPEEFAAEARRIHAESVAYWTAYPTADFWRRPSPEVWAPADQVRHLTKAIRAVTKGFAMPRLVLAFSFGWSRGGSGSFDALRERYQQALARGGRAGGFAPRVMTAAEATEEQRSRVMAHHAEAVERFAGGVAGWSARALDRYQLPHPLLGKLTLREMAQFTLLHNVHHVGVAERRRRENEGR